MEKELSPEGKCRLQFVNEKIKELGNNRAEFARLIERLPQQVNSWVKQNVEIGETIARDIEEKLNLPRGFVDKPQNVNFDIKDDVIVVNRYSIKLSAGFGCDITCEEPEGREYLDRGYIEAEGWKKDKLCVFTVDGDSMVYTLISGEKVVIDTSRTEPLDNRIFAIAKNGTAWIKRLIFNPNTMNYLVVSDNEAYHRLDFPLDDECKIIGLAVHTLGRKLYNN